MSKRLEMLETMIAKGSTDPFVHYAHAMELKSLERQDDALAAFEQVALRFPAYVPTYLMAGQLAVAMGKNPVARDLLERGLEAARTAGDGKALGEIKGVLAGLED